MIHVTQASRAEWIKINVFLLNLKLVFHDLMISITTEVIGADTPDFTGSPEPELLEYQTDQANVRDV